jgi:hypothetical protein
MGTTSEVSFSLKPGALQLSVVGIVQRLQVVVITLGHDIVLQQLFGAVELKIGAGCLDLRFLKIGPCLGSITALQRTDLFPFAHFLAGKDAEREHAAADQRIDVDHLGRIRHDTCRQNQLACHRLRVHGDGFDYLLPGSIGLRRNFVAMTGSRRKQYEGGHRRAEKKLPFHGAISVAAAKLSWWMLSQTC